MRRKTVLFHGLLVVLAVVFGGSICDAGAIILVGDSLDNMLGSSVTKVEGPLCSDTSDGNMVSEVCSSAYTGDNGLFVYLYQLNNDGVAGNSSIDTFTMFPFWGASDASQIGYLTSLDGTDGEFLAGGYDPLYEGFIEDPGTGPVISFYYSKDVDADIPVGEHSRVMYVLSDRSPMQITGNVIDGSVGSGPVLGAVPEPSTFCLLLVGCFGILASWRGRHGS